MEIWKGFNTGLRYSAQTRSLLYAWYFTILDMKYILQEKS